MKFRIVSDSSSNLLKWENIDYSAVPLKIISPEKEYIDDNALNVAEMVNELKTAKGVVKTSCPNPGEWAEAFEGADCIFAVTITSHLSGSFNSACIAKDQYIAEHPDVKICIIDSYCTGGGMQLIIEKLTELISSGLSFEMTEEAIMAYTKTVKLQFCLRSLSNLARNGRVSQTVAALAGVFNIRVIGKAVEGQLTIANKTRGDKKAISAIIANMAADGYQSGKVRINHCLNIDLANALKDKILSDYPSAQIEINECTALCSFYAEEGGIIIGYEC